jgi:hypothetical protein
MSNPSAAEQEPRYTSYWDYRRGELARSSRYWKTLHCCFVCIVNQYAEDKHKFLLENLFIQMISVSRYGQPQFSNYKALLTYLQTYRGHKVFQTLIRFFLILCLSCSAHSISPEHTFLLSTQRVKSNISFPSRHIHCSLMPLWLNRYIYCGSYDGTVQSAYLFGSLAVSLTFSLVAVYDLLTGETVSRLEGHSATVRVSISHSKGNGLG